MGCGAAGAYEVGAWKHDFCSGFKGLNPYDFEGAQSHLTGGGNSNIFGIFIPKLGEGDSHFD